MSRRSSYLNKVDRSALERERRTYTKHLFSRLAFLLPSLPTKFSSFALLNEAIAYVKQLKERIESLKQRKQLLEGTTDEMACGSRSRLITVRGLDFIFEVCMTNGLNDKFMLYQIITLLLEEAAEVVAVSYSHVGGSIFYTIYIQAVSSRIGIETSSLQERLKRLISHASHALEKNGLADDCEL